MKRVLLEGLRRFKKGIRIEIVIDVAYDFENIAAAIQHPASISKRKRVSETKLNILNEIVYSVMSAIHAQGFKVISTHQSKKSYSYYIKFWPITDEGERLFPIEFMFRISDHNIKQNEHKESSIVRIINLQLGGVDFDNSVDLILAADEICKGLKQGDLSILDKYVISGISS